MTISEDGFDEYVAARWAGLVRSTRLLGAPEPVSVEVATEALARLRGDWRRLRGSGDPDTEVRELLVEAWDARRRRPWARVDPPEDVPAALVELQAVPEQERLGVVLDHLDRVGERADQDDPRWLAARELPVAAPPPGRAELRAATRRRRERLARRALLPALAVVLLLAVAGVVTVLDDDPPKAPVLPRALPAVEVGEGPGVFVTWWASGLLHLGATTVEVPAVRAVVDVLGAAVYVDTAGDVVRVGPDGGRVLLGRTDDPTSLVASADGDLVGWVDVTSRAAPLLVVATATDGERRATYRLAQRVATRPVGLREDRMYVVDADRTRVWRFDGGDDSDDSAGGAGMGEPGGSGLDRLEQVVGQLAVIGPSSPSAASRLAFLDPQDRTPPESTWIPLPGEQVRLAPDGSLVASRRSAGDVELVAQGARGLQPSGLDDDEVALDVSVGPDRQVAYLVVQAGDRPTSRDLARSSYDGPLTLLTCTVSLSPRGTECTEAVDLTGSAELPVLAR